ncbi:Cyanidin 3-O-glucoside 5-O-glucosyltransferase [Bienertia sinuspersici]
MPEPRDYIADRGGACLQHSTEVSPTFISYPTLGLQGVLEHFKNIYDNPPVFIHENGQVTDYNVMVNDSSRVEYIQAHIGGVLDAVR